jgi:hypothetical protein
MTPQRIQLSRSKGWKMPENTVKVDRTTKWGNPFVVGKSGGAFTAKVMDRRHAWQLYRSIASDTEMLVRDARAELRGKNLACWCPHDDPYEDVCHAAVLLEIANVSDKPQTTVCAAVQYSDWMQCGVCHLAWDTNDADPPACPLAAQAAQVRRRMARGALAAQAALELSRGGLQLLEPAQATQYAAVLRELDKLIEML